MIERAAQGFEAVDDNFVHHHTGPAVWTDAVRLSIGIVDQNIDASALLKLAWSDVDVYRRAKSMGLCVMPEWFLGSDEAVNVRHLYASQTFDTSNYVRWKDERDALVAANGKPP
jgi:hypothetical protein